MKYSKFVAVVLIFAILLGVVNVSPAKAAPVVVAANASGWLKALESVVVIVFTILSYFKTEEKKPEPPKKESSWWWPF